MTHTILKNIRQNLTLMEIGVIIRVNIWGMKILSKFRKRANNNLKLLN